MTLAHCCNSATWNTVGRGRGAGHTAWGGAVIPSLAVLPTLIVSWGVTLPVKTLAILAASTAWPPREGHSLPPGHRGRSLSEQPGHSWGLPTRTAWPSSLLTGPHSPAAPSAISPVMAVSKALPVGTEDPAGYGDLAAHERRAACCSVL